MGLIISSFSPFAAAADVADVDVGLLKPAFVKFAKLANRASPDRPTYLAMASSKAENTPFAWTVRLATLQKEWEQVEDDSDDVFPLCNEWAHIEIAGSVQVFAEICEASDDAAEREAGIEVKTAWNEYAVLRDAVEAQRHRHLVAGLDRD